MLDGFDGHGSNVLVAIGLEEAFGIGSVGLVSTDVGSDVLRGKKNDGVTELLKLSGPVMSHAAGFHHDLGRDTLGKEAKGG